MTCEDFITSYLNGDGDSFDRRHLDTCERCAGQLADLRRTKEALADPQSWAVAEESLADRVVAAVGQVAGRTRRRRRWYAAAAVAALLLGVAAFALLAAADPPDWEVAIAGTEEAPGASGVIYGWETSSGTRIQMEVTGLGPAPEGSFYELWLTQGPLHVSAGTFRAFDGVELWVGVRQSDFPRLWITLEPATSDPGPSGHTVLDTDA